MDREHPGRSHDTGAACPLWLRFLDRIMGGNRDLIDYLQRVAGYALTGDVSEQCLWFLYGTGANGKTTTELFDQQAAPRAGLGRVRREGRR